MEELWDIARVAEYLGVSERTVYNRVRAGELPAIKVGRLWRVREADLRQWLGGSSAATSQARPQVPRKSPARPAADVPGPYPYASATDSLPAVAESRPLPTRADLERLLRPLVDPLDRRLAFVGLLTQAVEASGWPAPIVVGGHAVEYFTGGDYPTVDIDLAGASEPIAAILDSWGMLREGRHWYDEELKLLVEAPGSSPDSGALAHVTAVRIGGVTAYVLGIEDVVIDRLCAASFWGDVESRMWARVMLSTAAELDLEYLRKRAAAEDVAEQLDEILPEHLR